MASGRADELPSSASDSLLVVSDGVPKDPSNPVPEGSGSSQLVGIFRLLESLNTRLESLERILTRRPDDGPRCAACKAKLTSKREPYPGGLCWQCWAVKMDRRMAHGGSP